jgi:Ca2+-binding RTX toxin-like protein
MRKQPSARSAALAVSSCSLLLSCCALLAACQSEQPAAAIPSIHDDTSDYPGISETGGRNRLVALTKPCTFDAATGAMAVVIQAGETAVIDANGGPVKVNGVSCGTATATNVKRLDVTEDPAAAGDQAVILDYSGGNFALGSPTAGRGVFLDLGSGSDQLKLQGTSGNDRYTLGASGLSVSGGSNLDVHVANGANLKIVVSTGPGDDKVSGAGGGAFGAPYPYGLEIYGGAGNDTLTGGAGDDTILGGDGDDVLSGGGGHDLLLGENGNDTFLAGSVSGAGSVYLGGAGTDFLDYSKRTHALTVVMDAVWTGVFPAGSASGTPSGEGGGSEGDRVGADIENLTAGSGDDTLTGNAMGNILNGGAGNDTFLAVAAVAADVFIGGPGLDTVDYSVRTHALALTIDGKPTSGEGGEGDTIDLTVENLIGGSGNDTLTGSAAANRLEGGPGDDTLYGMDGDDVLIGGAGNDTLYGGNGDDTFLYLSATGTEGHDTIYCGAGTDLLDYSARSADVTVDLRAGSTTTGSSGDSATMGGTADECEVAYGGTGNNTLIGNSLDNTLDGNALSTGASTIDGQGGVDVCMNAGVILRCEL